MTNLTKVSDFESVPYEIMDRMRKILVVGVTLASLVVPMGASAATSNVVLLYAKGIGDARFGQATGTAIAALERALSGPLTRRPVYFPRNCNINGVLRWPTLSAYFFEGRFVGYGYTTRTDMGYGSMSRRRLPRAVTSQGLTIGDTLERGRMIYGTHFKATSGQMGTWSVATPVGTFRGYLSSEPHIRIPPARIATIGAGSLGCPGVSP